MVFRFYRPWAVASAVFVGLAGAVSEKDAVSMDSHGSLTKASSGLIRRHHHQDTDAARSEREAAERGASQAGAKASSVDSYVLVGDNRCDGGGLWKRYEMNSHKPGRYEFCADACNDKDECIGFDVGNTGCNMYTQKAVAIGTWSAVRMHNGGPLAGEGDHNDFPRTPFDLTLGTVAPMLSELFKCYRKTYYKPVDSYYWLIGGGTCSGGGLWKRYVMDPGNYSTCSTACNMRDECIGFDVGTWAISDVTTQVKDANGAPTATFTTELQTETACHMYVQKQVHGTWPHVQAGTAMEGEGDHDAFPETPNMLSLGHIPRYEVNGATQCFGKTHWVGLDQYYTILGNTLCTGAGAWHNGLDWKHYKAQATLSDCKALCDMQDVCVGIDHEVYAGTNVTARDEHKGCRLYTRVSVAADAWGSAVEFNPHYMVNGVARPGPFDGKDFIIEGHGGAYNVIHDTFPGTPFDLSCDTHATPDPNKVCLAKTHYDAPDEHLFESSSTHGDLDEKHGQGVLR